MKVNYAQKHLLTFTRRLFTTPEFLTLRASLDAPKPSKHATGKRGTLSLSPFMSRDSHNIRLSRLITQNKVTFNLSQATKAQTGSSGKALLSFFKLDSRWGVLSTPQRYPLHRRLDGPQGRSSVRKISPPRGFDP